MSNINIQRDYSRAIAPVLRGEKGLRAYVKIVTSPRVRYNAKLAAEQAARNLRKQGLSE